jgi:hypothetical protein
MTMPTHTRGSFERAPDATRSRDPAATGVAAPDPAMIKRFFTCALMVLAAGGGVAAILALKVAIYLPRFIHP